MTTVLLTLSSAQFLMTLDSSVMNVSISTVAQDVGTSVTGIQTAITLYTLVMASLMITGGKLGEILSRKRAFAIGCVVYGVGSLTTSLAPNLAVLMIGWSLLDAGRTAAVADGARTLSLWILDGNNAAGDLYVRAGFARTGERRPWQSSKRRSPTFRRGQGRVRAAALSGGPKGTTIGALGPSTGGMRIAAYCTRMWCTQGRSHAPGRAARWLVVTLLASFTGKAAPRGLSSSGQK